MAAVLRHQRRARHTLNMVANVAVLATAYAFANVPLALVLLIFASGVALGASASRLRAFGERYRLIEKLAPVIAAEDARALRRVSRDESRKVLRVLTVTAIVLIPTIVWAMVGRARGLVAVACIVALAYLRSSIKALMPGAPGFTELAKAARARGCRITLFRSFADGPSRLTRNILLPLLAGYGDLNVVFDQTLGSAERESFLGEEVPDLGRIATVYRFKSSEWPDRVAELIAQTDIAIIEATKLTPGVVWEFARCIKVLPPWRVYPLVDLDGLGDTPVAQHIARFYERVGREPDMPEDVRTRWFYLGPGAFQAETISTDLHGRMLAIIAIESGVEDASVFGPGAAAWLPGDANDDNGDANQTVTNVHGPYR